MISLCTRTIFIPFLKMLSLCTRGIFTSVDDSTYKKQIHLFIFVVQNATTKRAVLLWVCIVWDCGGGGGGWGQVALMAEVGICLYARGRMNFNYLRFGIRYSDAGIATSSYLTYTICASLV